MAYMPYNNYKGEYMADFEVIFYEKENGDCPVEQFISSLDVKMRAKMVGLLELLEEKGNQLREPYSKPIDDGIFEIRCKVGKIMKTLQQLKDEQMKDPAFAKEYEAIQPEMDVIRAIVEARTSQNITQKELAERTGINQADISKLENGTRNPSVNLLKRLADGMGMALKIEFVPKQNV